MKLAAIVTGMMLAVGAWGQSTTTTTNYTIGLAIPDNNFSGLASTKTFSSPITALTDLNVFLNISGTYNGDLYAYLTYQSGFSVLLNRVGRRTGSSLGYGDDGINVTLDDEGANGDIHVYRLTLNGSHTIGLTGGLTNTTGGVGWLPDGRNIDPTVSLDSTTRTALLSSFDGLNPNGNWTLFVADVNGGDLSTLVSWGLEAVGTVPEPGTTVLLALGGLGLLVLAGRRRR